MKPQFLTQLRKSHYTCLCINVEFWLRFSPLFGFVARLRLMWITLDRSYHLTKGMPRIARVNSWKFEGVFYYYIFTGSVSEVFFRRGASFNKSFDIKILLRWMFFFYFIDIFNYKCVKWEGVKMLTVMFSDILI